MKKECWSEMTENNGVFKPVSSAAENVRPGECCPYCWDWSVVTLPYTASDWCGRCGTVWIYTLEGERYVYRPLCSHVSRLDKVRNFVFSWFRR